MLTSACVWTFAKTYYGPLLYRNKGEIRSIPKKIQPFPGVPTAEIRISQNPFPPGAWPHCESFLPLKKRLKSAHTSHINYLCPFLSDTVEQ